MNGVVPRTSPRQIRTLAVEQTLEDGNDQQTNHQHVEGGHALVHQHLVHDDMEGQWADQSEKLQYEADQKDFAEELAGV